MNITTEAWVLAQSPAPAILNQKAYTFDYRADTEVLIAPLWGCWEANMAHALERKPIDVCAFRKEPEVVLGNGGVVKVLNPGPRKDLKQGDICIFLSFAEIHHTHGFPRAAHGYDAPGTVGLLAKKSKCLPHQLIKLPCALKQPEHETTLQRWAAFALRYVTAWANWEIAHGTYRLLLPKTEAPEWVIAWGGGVAFAELQLAQKAGFSVAMFSQCSKRIAALEHHGIKGLLRSDNSNDMLEQVKDLTQKKGAAIFVDLIGEPVIKTTLKMLGCPGVLTTAGWKAGMQIKYQRAIACMQWQSFVHTHYARPDQATSAVNYAQSNNWLPPLNDFANHRVWSWDAIPELAQAYQQGECSYFPIYKVND